MHISQVQYIAARPRSCTIMSVLKQATSSTAATHVSYPTRTRAATTYVVPASITIRKYRHLIANSLCISSTAQTPHIEYVSATVSHVQAVAHTLEHTTGPMSSKDKIFLSSLCIVASYILIEIDRSRF